MVEARMDRQAVKEQVLGIISKYLEPGQVITDKHDMMGIDSMDVVDIVVEIEQRFNIRIPNEEIQALETFDQLMGIIFAKMESA